MANEVTYADLVTNGGAVAEVLSALMFEALHDPTDLRAVCRKVDFDYLGSASNRVTITPAPLPFVATAEGTAVANTALTTSDFDLAIGKYSRAYEVTDLVPMAGGKLDIEQLVQKLSSGVGLTITDMVTAMFSSLSTQTSGTGAVLDVDGIYEGIYLLNLAGASAPLSCVLHPKQMNEFRTSLRGETGALAFTPPSAEILKAAGSGLQGEWNNISFWQSDSVTSAGGDRQGAIFDMNAFAYALGDVKRLQKMIPQQNVLLDAGEVIVEMVRDGYGGQSAAVAHMYPAVATVEDARAVLVESVA